MGNGFHTQSLPPLDPGMSMSARDMAQQVAADYARQEEKAFEDRTKRGNELIGEARRRVRDLFEGDNYQRFRHFLWTESMRTRDLMLPPDGLKTDAAELHRDRKERADAFLREHGVEPERLTQLASELRSSVGELVNLRLEGNTGAVYPASRFHELHPQKPEPRAFATHPPFSGWQRGFHFANLIGSGFRGDQFVTLIPSDGVVGHQVRLTNDDASDFDFAEEVADAQVAFWFEPGVSGRVRMTIEAQCQLAAHTLRTEDEFGWSDSSTTQDNFLMMHVLHQNVAGPTFAHTSNFIWRTDESEDVFRQFIPIGTTVFGTMTSNGALPAGQPVVIRAGTRTINNSWTNDVVIHSTPDFRWLLKTIAIQMVP